MRPLFLRTAVWRVVLSQQRVAGNAGRRQAEEAVQACIEVGTGSGVVSAPSWRHARWYGKSFVAICLPAPFCPAHPSRRGEVER